MKKKRLWKSLAAWMLVLGMVFSDGSFAVYAQEAQGAESAGKEDAHAGATQAEKQDSQEIKDEGQSSEGESQITKDEGQPAENDEEGTGAEDNGAEQTKDSAGSVESAELQDAGTDEGTPDADGEPDGDLSGETSSLWFEMYPVGDERLEQWDAENRYLSIYEGQSVLAEVQKDHQIIEGVSWAVYKDEAAVDGLLEIEGNKLSFGMLEGEADADYILCATVGEMKENIKLHVRKQRYEYQPDMEENILLKDARDWFDSVSVECYNAKNPWGNFCGEASVISAIVTDGEGFVTCKESDDGDGWDIYGKELGTATVEITCNRLEGDPAGSGKVTFTRKYKVVGYTCELRYSLPDDNEDMLMLPGATMTVSGFEMLCSSMKEDEDGDRYQQEEIVKNPKWSVVKTDPRISSAVFEGNNLVITAGTGAESGDASVLVRAESSDGKYKCEEELTVQIEESYYLVLPAKVDNVGLGEIIDFNKIDLQLMYFDKANPTGKKVTDAKFSVEYESYDIWESQKSSAPLPVLKRISPDSAYIHIHASIPSEGEDDDLYVGEVALYFDSISYYADIKYTYEGYPEGQGTNTMFEGTPLKLGLVAEADAPAFPEECEVKWTITTGEQYVTKVDNGFSTTLTAKQLPDQGEDGDNYYNVNMNVLVTYGGRELFEDYVYIYACKPMYNDEVSLGSESEVLVGEDFAVKPVVTSYYMDASAPDGETAELRVTDVKIDRECQWDDNGNEIKVANGKVASLTGDAKAGWVLHGKEDGIVWLSVSYMSVTGKELKSKLVDVNVSSDIYRLNWSYPESYKGWIKPGQKMTIDGITMSHEYLDSGNKIVKENVTDFELKVTNEDGDEVQSYDDGLIAVQVNGKSLEITGKSEGRTEIPLIGITKAKESNESYSCYYNIPIEVSVKEICDVHTWSDWKETKPATCTEAGLMKRICKVCGTEEMKDISAGHKWGAWTANTAPTVFAAGTQARTCSVCKKTESRAYGNKLAPTMTVTANSLKMQVKQKTSGFKVTGMANGDSVASVTSGNTKVLKVSGVNKNGTFKLTAQKKAGSAKLTIRLASGLTKVVKVTVQKKAVKTTKISGLSKKLSMKKGGKAKLAPVIAPVTSKDKVTYKTSNKKVATVTSKGLIKAKKRGKAKITVKSGSKKFTVTVTVK